jgi:hypothetical protein
MVYRNPQRWAEFSVTFVFAVAVHALNDSNDAVIPGVHKPLPVSPDVDIDNGQWLLDLYPTVLGRHHDVVGYATDLAAARGAAGRAGVYAAFTASAEFQGNPALADKDRFVTRVYGTILRRNPTPAEVSAQAASLTAYDGSGSGTVTWLGLIDAFYASAEFKTHCQTGYYTMGAPVSQGQLLLHDMFDGRAKLQPENASQPIRLTMPSALRMWDQKLSVMVHPTRNDTLLAFTRCYLRAPNVFTVALLTSTDGGLSFTEVAILWDPAAGARVTIYDPHVAVDNSVCPPRFVMATECAGNFGTASLCVSSTTTPHLPETWYYPTVVVDGFVKPAAESASTGVTLTDGLSRHVAWTQVYDGTKPNDPLAHTYSQNAIVPSFYNDYYFGTVVSPGVMPMMNSQPHPWCTDAWDCNNRDKQDWKREGDYFYAM